MRVVVAPDSFKESMTASEVANAIERGIDASNQAVEVIKVPLADGGEGTAEVLINHFQAMRVKAVVTGPMGDDVTVMYGLTDNGVAIMDVASVIGLPLVPEQKRNPLYTTTYGVGELIIDALDRGVNHFIIGLGGSSTNDGGIGMVQALGVRVDTVDGKAVPLGGVGLERVATITLDHLDPRVADCTFTIVSDVMNELLGELGATYVYGRQKGANKAMLQQLESGMSHYASILERDVKSGVVHLEASGAAGGLGVAFRAFLDADIRRGIDYVMSLTHLEHKIKKADLVITGEGKIDDQTLHGKVPFGVAQLAQKYNIPVIAITGMNEITTDKLYEAGIRAIFSIINKPMSLVEAMERSNELIERTVENIIRLYHSSN